MSTLIDYFIALFRDARRAGEFVRDPKHALAESGHPDVDVAQLNSVAAAAMSGMGYPGSSVLDLQRAVAAHHGTDAGAESSGQGLLDRDSEILSGNPIDIPIDTEASHNDTEVHDNTTQLGSHNATSLASPELNFGTGDLVFGDNTSASGDGAVAISGSADGPILSGEAAMLGDGNDARLGDIQTGSNTIVASGDGSGVVQDNGDRHEDAEAAPDHAEWIGLQCRSEEAYDAVSAGESPMRDEWSSSLTGERVETHTPAEAFDLFD